jgi:hypothetical protein
LRMTRRGDQRRQSNSDTELARDAKGNPRHPRHPRIKYSWKVPAARAAFEGLIDYAGLYPPASLQLDAVVGNYATYRSGAHSWMLGRLIVPIEKLAALEGLARNAGASPDDRWPVSVLVGDAKASGGNATAIQRAVETPESVLTIEGIEAVATTPVEVAAIAHTYPAAIDRFVETPSDSDPMELIAAIGSHRCAAKIRTGGVTPEAFPPPARLARFLARAAAARVPMKATAGLHHAIRGDRRLTYASDSASTAMHGFVNLVIAATLLTTGRIDEDLAGALLDDDRPEVFKFGGRAGSWLNAVVTYTEIAHARGVLLRSVGSCSFDEPVRELTALGWI